MREELIDRWLPQWDFHEYHSVEIDALWAVKRQAESLQAMKQSSYR